MSIATGSKLVVFSGQVVRMSDGTPAGDTVRTQFAQALRNFAAVASAVDVETRHLAKTTVYVKDLRPEHLEDLYAAVNG